MSIVKSRSHRHSGSSGSSNMSSSCSHCGCDKLKNNCCCSGSSNKQRRMHSIRFPSNEVQCLMASHLVPTIKGTQ